MHGLRPPVGLSLSAQHNRAPPCAGPLCARRVAVLKPNLVSSLKEPIMQRISVRVVAFVIAVAISLAISGCGDGIIWKTDVTGRASEVRR
jgi:hypothetical protein